MNDLFKIDMFVWRSLVTMTWWLKSNDYDKYMIKISSGKSTCMTMSILWLWPKLWYPYDIMSMFTWLCLHDYDYIYDCLYDEWYQRCMISYDWLVNVYFRHMVWLMSESRQNSKNPFQNSRVVWRILF